MRNGRGMSDLPNKQADAGRAFLSAVSGGRWHSAPTLAPTPGELWNLLRPAGWQRSESFERGDSLDHSLLRCVCVCFVVGDGLKVKSPRPACQRTQKGCLCCCCCGCCCWLFVCLFLIWSESLPLVLVKQIWASCGSKSL